MPSPTKSRFGRNSADRSFIYYPPCGRATQQHGRFRSACQRSVDNLTPRYATATGRLGDPLPVASYREAASPSRFVICNPATRARSVPVCLAVIRYQYKTRHWRDESPSAAPVGILSRQVACQFTVYRCSPKSLALGATKCAWRTLHPSESAFEYVPSALPDSFGAHAALFTWAPCRLWLTSFVFMFLWVQEAN